MTTYPWRRRGAGPIAAAVLVVLMLGSSALAGCGSSPTSNATTTPGFAGPDAAKDAGGAAAAEPGQAPGAGSTGNQSTDQKSPTTQLEPQQRSLIYTGSMSVTVRDVVKAANDAGGIAVAAGGNVSADRRSLDADRSTAQLTLRVPSEAFQSTLDKLARLGDEVNRSVQTQDVTESIVDIESRLQTQRASVDRVRALLAQATTVGEVVTIESELTRREADLDSLEQRKARLAGLVALSTITLDLRGPASAPPAAEPEGGFIGGVKAGWRAFVASVKVFLLIIGWVLPWAAAIGIPLWIVLRITRRRRRPGPAPATAPAEPTAPIPTPADGS